MIGYLSSSIQNLLVCDDGTCPSFLKINKSHNAAIALKNNVVAVLYFSLL